MINMIKIVYFALCPMLLLIRFDQVLDSIGLKILPPLCFQLDLSLLPADEELVTGLPQVFVSYHWDHQDEVLLLR